MNKPGEENNIIIFRHFLSFFSLSLSFFSTVDRSILFLLITMTIHIFYLPLGFFVLPLFVVFQKHLLSTLVDRGLVQRE